MITKKIKEQIVFYMNMPVVIVSLYDSLNLVKVRSAENNRIFYVDKKFLTDCPQKLESVISVTQLLER